jgi:hypothetical protein
MTYVNFLQAWYGFHVQSSREKQGQDGIRQMERLRLKITAMLARRQKLADLLQAWHKWRGLVSLARLGFKLSSKALRREDLRLAAWSVGAWCSLTRYKNQQRRVLSRSVGYVCKDVARLAILAWVAYIDARLQARLGQKRAGARRAVALRIVLRMHERLLGTAFDVFKAFVAEKKLDAAKHGRVKDHVTFATKCSALDVWAARTRHLKSFRSKYSKSLFQRARRNLIKGLGAWYVHALLRLFRRQTVGKMLARMTRRRAVSAVDSLIANVCARKACCKARKEKAEAKSQMLFSLSAIASRWDARMLDNALLTWQDLVLEQKIREGTRARVLSSWARRDSRVQMRAWGIWEVVLKGARRKRALDARSARFWLQQAVHGVLRLWALFAASHRAKRVQRSKAKMHARKVLLSLAHLAWFKWCDDVQVARGAKRMLQRLCKMLVRQAFLLWHEMRREKKSLRSSAERVVMRCEFSAFSKSLASWWQAVLYTRKKLTAMRTQRVHSRVRAVRSWSAKVVSVKRSRALAARAMSRINSTNGLLWRAWTQWEFHVCDMRAAKDRTGLSLVLSHAASTLSISNYITMLDVDCVDSTGAEVRRRGIC